MYQRIWKIFQRTIRGFLKIFSKDKTWIFLKEIFRGLNENFFKNILNYQMWIFWEIFKGLDLDFLEKIFKGQNLDFSRNFQRTKPEFFKEFFKVH